MGVLPFTPVFNSRNGSKRESPPQGTRRANLAHRIPVDSVVLCIMLAYTILYHLSRMYVRSIAYMKTFRTDENNQGFSNAKSVAHPRRKKRRTSCSL